MLAVLLQVLSRIVEFLIFFARVNLASFKRKYSDSFQNLNGKTAIVTGGNSGIGYTTVCLLASRGCRVIIADKSTSEKPRNDAIESTRNPNIELCYLDLASLKSVRQFVEKIKEKYTKIDILINNAGIAFPDNLKSEDELNYVMQVNYFSPFLLTHLLLDVLNASGSGRVVFTASCLSFTHLLGKSTFNQFNCEKTGINIFKFYSNSKLCNVIAAQEFTRRFNNLNVTYNSVDPGVVRTQIYNYSKTDFKEKIRTSLFMNILIAIYQTDGLMAAQSTFHVASSERLENKSGLHYFNCESFMKPWICYDEEMCEFVWRKSEELVKLRL